MQCQIINVGNELLIGDTPNTNAGWLGQMLTEAGIDVTYIHTIGDNLNTLKSVISAAISDSDLVITTGGLGPTHDDITKKAVTEIFDCEMKVDEEVLNFIKKTFEKRNIPISKSNYQQAEVPDCCEVLFNKQGTAPGMWFEREQAKLAVLPGVPFEMKHLIKEKVLPRLRKINGDTVQYLSRYFSTAGVGESTLSDEIIGDLNPVVGNEVSVAYLPNPQGADIRISASGNSKRDIENKIAPVTSFIKKKAGYLIIGEGKDMSIPKAVGQVLRDRDLWLATAESCTGGFISNAITDIPGSSRYFKGGVNAYSNDVKMNHLNVNSDAISENGAVSKPVALQMAKGVAQNLGADIGISTTGIAGPSGGTNEKPVGMVWIGFWRPEQHFALKAHFTNDRFINKERSSAVALETVRRCVLDIPEMPYGLKKDMA